MDEDKRDNLKDLTYVSIASSTARGEDLSEGHSAEQAREHDEDKKDLTYVSVASSTARGEEQVKQ